MTFWKSEHFKALQKAWYQRLEETGFKDHERLIGDELLLKQFANPYKHDEGEIERETKEQYYAVIAQRVAEAAFRNKIDEFILSAWAEGKKIKAICDELERQGRSRCRLTVLCTIRRYEMLWGLRTYTPQQMNRYEKKKQPT